MRGITIGLDVDEVVADLHKPWLRWGNTRFGTNHREFTHWDAPQDWWGEGATDFIRPGIYLSDDVLPIVGAQLAVDLLREIGYTVCFVTSCRGDDTLLRAKAAWLYRHGLLRGMELVESLDDKSLAPVDVLVDDGYHNVKNFHQRAVLVTAPHNRDEPWQGVRIKHVADLPYVLARL